MTDQTIKRSGDFFYTEVEDGVKLVGYLGYDYPTYAPDTINGKPVTVIGEGCKEGLKTPYQLILPKTVREIEFNAVPVRILQTKTWLNKITIPEESPYFSVNGSFICTKDQKTLLFRLPHSQIPSVEIPARTEVIEKYMFYGSDFTEVVIPPSVKEIREYAFSHTKLKNVDIPVGVEYIGDQCFFTYCDTTITLHGNTRLGQAAANRFKIADGCTAYIEENGFLMTADKKRLIRYQLTVTDTDIVIPETIEEIDDYAFNDVYGTTTVTLNKKLRRIGHNVFPKAVIEEVCINEDLEYFAEDSFGRYNPIITINSANKFIRTDGTAIYRRLPNCRETIVKIIDRSLFRYTIPGTVDSFRYDLFDNCDKMTRLILQEGFKEWTEYSALKNIKCIVIPSTVEIMNVEKTRSNDRIKYIISEENPHFFVDDDVLYHVNGEDDFTLMLAMNRECTMADIIEGTTEIADHAFFGCVKLKDVIIQSTVKEIGDCAFGDTGVKNLVIPEGVEVILDHAFRDCPRLTRVTLPKSLELIADTAFSGCAHIKEYKVAEGNRFFAAKDGALFDAEMTKLYNYPFGKKDKEYSIPEGVSKLSFTFGDMPKDSCLESVTLPSSIKSIGGRMFTDTLLKDIYFTSDVKINNSYTITSGGFEKIRIHAKNCPNVINFVNKRNEYKNSSLVLADQTDTDETQQIKKIFSFDKVSDGYRIYAYKNNGGTAVFPSTLLGERVTELSLKRGDSFFKPNSIVYRIVISEGIKRIGAGFFMNLPRLGSVSIPESVEYIDKLAFADRDGKYEGLYLSPKTRFYTVPGSYADKFLSSYYVEDYSLKYPVVVHEGDEIEKTIGTPECFSYELLPDGTVKAELKYGSDENDISRPIVPCVAVGRPVTVFSVNKYFIGNDFKELYVSKNIKSIEYSEYYFSYALKLFEVDPENEVFSSDGIALLSKDRSVIHRVFCQNIKEYNVPDTVRIVKKHAFASCPALKRINISVPIDLIEEEAFRNAKRLETINGIEIVKEIRQGAFTGTMIKE